MPSTEPSLRRIRKCPGPAAISTFSAPAGGWVSRYPPVGPQPITFPSLRTAKSPATDAEIRAYVRPGGSGGTSRLPSTLLPHATTLPSDRRASEWKLLAAISTACTPGGSVGALHCPAVLTPQPTTPPSLRVAR